MIYHPFPGWSDLYRASTCQSRYFTTSNGQGTEPFIEFDNSILGQACSSTITNNNNFGWFYLKQINSAATYWQQWECRQDLAQRLNNREVPQILMRNSALLPDLWPDLDVISRCEAENFARIKAASAKGRKLLRRLLTSQQWQEYQQYGFITITSQSGQRYRLDGHSNVRNITRLDAAGLEVEVLCAHPAQYDLPIEDVLVAQKLHLELNEAEFRRIANITQGRPGTRIPSPPFASSLVRAEPVDADQPAG